LTAIKQLQTTVAIIGAGPAGCAAAIQLKRAAIKVVLFEEKNIGGLALNANLIENYLGIAQGVDGLSFGKKMVDHLDSLAIKTVFERVQSISIEKNKIILRTEQTECFCEYLIIATGTTAKKLQTTGAEEAEKKGLLFYEPVDIPSEKLQQAKVVVIGGGDAAFDYSLQLAQKTAKVVILHRRKHFTCLPLLYTRVLAEKNIELIYPKKLLKIVIDNNRQATFILQDKSEIRTDLLLPAIGRTPNDRLLRDTPKELLNKRIYPIGDLVNQHYRQIAIATGEGLKTAMQLIEKIANDKK
jgi:thioredoxin reductase (NADPH)